MEDDEELIEFCLPSNEKIEPFFHLTNEKKIKIIELGLMCYNQTNEKIHYWNNKDMEDKINKIIQDKDLERDKIEDALHQTQDLLNNKDKIYNEERIKLIESIRTEEAEKYKLLINEKTESLKEIEQSKNELYKKMDEIRFTIDEKVSIKEEKLKK